MATIENPSIPRSIHHGLSRVGRRIRWLGVVRGIGLLVAVMTVGAVGGMAADFVWVLPEAVRWAFWLAWVGTGLAVLGTVVVGPLVRRLSWAELAAVAEAGHPELGERLVSTVELLGSGQASHGSPELIGALVEETEARARGLDLARAVTGRSAGRWLAIGTLTAVVVVGPAILWPDPFATLGQRFLMPWSGIDRVDRFIITVKPGDVVAAIGSDVDVQATVRPRFGGGQAHGSAWLEWTDVEGNSHRVAMAADSIEPATQRAFTSTLKGIRGSINYRVVSGSATSRTQRITAVEPPAIATLSMRVEPPSYTKAPAFDAKDPSRLNVWEGSRIILSITPSKPLEQASVQWPIISADGSRSSNTVPLKPMEDGQNWTATIAAEVSGTYPFALLDHHGLKNRPEMPRSLRVVADTAPVVALGGTVEPLESKPDDILLVEVAARDDVAVASATLHYAITRADSDADEPEEGTTAAMLEGFGTRTAAGQAALVLKSLSLESNDKITYFLEVADNRPAPRGPNVTRTEPRLLRIADRARPLLEQQGKAEHATLREKLEALRRAAAANQQAAVQLRYAADAALRGNGHWAEEQARALADREGEARKVIDGLDELARDFLETGRFAPLARPARQIAEVEAEGARAMLDQARQADDANRRLADLRQADARLAVVKDRLDELARQFEELARQDEDRRRLGLLAERQEELARRAMALAREGANPDALERIRQEQEALRREVDELTHRSPELRAEVVAQRAREAEALARRARELAEHQREEARRNPETPERTEALRALSREQQKIEVAARRLAMEVDPALRENGRGRLNIDALARPLDPLAHGDTEQARQRLIEAEDALRQHARDLVEVRTDPKALARRLVRQQQELNNRAHQAIREARTPEAKAALPKTLRALAERQTAIARHAEAIPAADMQKNQVRQAVEKTTRAAEDLRENHVDQIPARLNEARAALDALANALPDLNQHRNQFRQHLSTLRAQFDQNGRELALLLRETAPRPDAQADPVALARELARRIEPLIQRQDEIAAKLAALDTDAAPQRDRASRRVAALADALKALHEAAPPESSQTRNRPGEAAADWQLIGPFVKNMPPPFPVGGPINLKGILKDKMNRAAIWKDARVGEGGLIDLNANFPGVGNEVSAFGYAEINSPSAGPGRLAIGSDDTLMVWLNGKKVFDFQGNRRYAPGQDRVAVAFAEGVNRLVIRCGNDVGDWKFSIDVTTPPNGELARQLARVEQFRRHLPLVQSDARAALDRLREALDGREPADDLVAELAKELKKLKFQISDGMEIQDIAKWPDGARHAAAEEARRIATALRGLNVPDAPAPQAEAVRLAQHAVRALEQSSPAGQAAPAPAEKVEPSRAIIEAARAAESLSERLTSVQSPGDRARAIAQAQRGLNEADAPRDPGTQARLQHALADDLTRIPPSPSMARIHAEEAMDVAVALADRANRQPDPEALADARTRAAKAIDELAHQFPERPAMAQIRPVTEGANSESNHADAPDDSELAIQPEHAQTARNLAHRERHLRQRLQALLADRIESQEQLRGMADALGRDLAGLRDQASELSPQSQGPASQAAQLLQGHAVTAMTQAADQFAQGRSDAARNFQRQAADHAEHAAQAAADLVAALRADLPPDAQESEANITGDEPTSTNNGLASAREAQQRAGEQLAEARESGSSPSQATRSAEAASTAMRQAAQGLRDAAAPGRRSLARLAADSAKTTLDPRGGLGSPAESHLGAIPGELAADPRSGRNWGELPGHLRTEILQMSHARYRDDYARLIQLYFREIAGAPGSEVPEK